MLSAASAQPGRWDFRDVTYDGTSKFGTRVAVDRWGNSHMVWGAQAVWGVRSTWGEQARAGIQLFYANDAVGRFSSPVQITDTTSGAVYLRDSATTPWAFKLDRNGGVHLAYIANHGNNLKLFYISNTDTTRRFRMAEELWKFNSFDEFSFDLAVDSTGSPHLVWIDRGEKFDQILIHYWSHATQDTVIKILEWPTAGVPNPCWVGQPEIEVTPDGRPVITFRKHQYTSGTLYLLRQLSTRRFDELRMISTSPHGDVLNGVKDDLRLRMAVDSRGGAHIILPYVESVAKERRYRFLYLNVDPVDPGTTGDARMLTADPLDTIVGDFDMAYNGADRIDVVWSTRRRKKSPMLGFAELVPDRHALDGPWITAASSADLNLKLKTRPTWRDEVRVAAFDEQVVVGGAYKISSSTAEQQVALIARSSLNPRIRYILPDAAAPGMSVVVDAYAHVRELGGFGPDGFRPDSAQLELADPADAERVVLGPSVVSWDGRLAQTMLFVKAGATPGAVPLRLRVGNTYSNIDTFYIVEPQHIGGASGVLSGGGALGSDKSGNEGMFGRRSKRGVLVVDSLILSSGIYTIDTSDCDPSTPGNQGYLPVTILSRGPVRIDAEATLSVSGWSNMSSGLTGAGPGGGGGGSGGNLAGGSGYTGGGGLAHNNGIWEYGLTMGSGGMQSGFWSGGRSLNGAPGGATYPYSTSLSGPPAGRGTPAGGGTGHPFGAAGLYGQVSPTEPVDRNNGGYGGATAGMILPSYPGGITTGGGGGGHGLAGEVGGDNTSGVKNNHGRAVGSRHLVPVSGGSGGGAGGYSSGGFSNGGSGGGMLALFSFGTVTVEGKIEANGSSGLNTSLSAYASGGGGGAGGGLLIGAQGDISFGTTGKLLAEGGPGGLGVDGGSPGGKGGNGRIRIDGKLATEGGGIFLPLPGFFGPMNRRSGSMQSRPNQVISGFGTPDSIIRLFTRPEGGGWSFKEIKVGKNGTWRDTLKVQANAPRFYTFVMQRVTNPSRSEYQSEPDWVMSPAAANILGRPKAEIHPDSIGFSCIHFKDTADDFVIVENKGELSDLSLTDIRIDGPGAAAFRIENVPAALEVEPGSKRSLRVIFAPTLPGIYEATLHVTTNDLGRERDSVKLVGCAYSGQLKVREQEIDLGELCVEDMCRMASVMLRNTGTGPLAIERIEGFGDVAIDPSSIEPRLPFAIEPGGSREVKLQLCLETFDADAGVVVESNAVDSILTLTVRGANASPDADVPESIILGTIGINSGDSCTEHEVTIRNRSASVPMQFEGAEVVASTSFELLDLPAQGSVIAPDGEHKLRIRFCADSARDYSAMLRMVFSNDPCTIETMTLLQGTGTLERPEYVVIEPAKVHDERVIEFNPTLVDTESERRTITIKNIGDVSGGTISIANDNPTQFHLVPSDPSIPGLVKRGEKTFQVFMKPTTVGNHSGTITLSSSDPRWSETIYLYGRGTKQGLRFSQTIIDFGAHCVGTRTASFALKLDNISADVPVQIERVSQPAGPFTLDSASKGLPIVLFEDDEMFLYYSFEPHGEGPFQDTVTVFYGDEAQIVILRGEGVSGHIGVSTDAMRFICRDTLRTFTLINTSACSVTVSDLRIISTSAAFSIASEPSFIIPPNELRDIAVRYRAGTEPASAMIEGTSTAPESIAIKLDGEACPVEIPKISFVLPNVSGVVGDVVMLPVMVDVDPSVTVPVDYEVTITYAYDLLAPLVDPTMPGAPPSSAWSAGTVSSVVKGKETALGKLQLRGTIIDGSRSDKLVNIPFRVLLGQSYRTDLTFESITISLSGASFSKQNGTFQALDCDTNGSVLILGSYALDQNMPNPFNPSTIIGYSIARHERVRLNIYDAAGNFIKTMIDEDHAPGRYEFRLDASSLPSGIYTYELVSGKFRKTRRMVILE